MSEFEKSVTLIIPFYNDSCTLKKCLDSVSAQTIDKDKLEVILVNDGSTDDSADICRNFALENNNTVVISKNHEGPSIARNSGIRIAKGRYITFLDSDDTISKNTLESLAEFFDKYYDKTDIVTYKLIPQKKGNRRSFEFRYDDVDTGIYDLNFDKGTFLCPDSMNFAIKNRNDDNLFFKHDEVYDLETLEFCINCAKEKNTVGFVSGCEYYKLNNPSGASKESHCSIYYDNFTDKWCEILSVFPEKPKWIQNLFIGDMLKRLSEDYLLPYHLDGEEYRIKIKKLQNLFSDIEDKLIIEYPDSGLMNRYYLISLKYKGNLNSEADEKLKLVHDDKILFESDRVDLTFTKIKPRKNEVEVCGYISSPIFEYCEKPTLLLRERNSVTPIPIRECSFCFDEAKVKNNTAWGFRKVFEIKKRTSFSFTVEIGERSYPVIFKCGEWVPFTKDRKSFVLNGMKCNLSDKCIVIEKASSNVERKYKRTELSKYLKKNKKVFAVRLLNYLIPKKRIWLYHDCKGVGTDNAYYQFMHDFDINDGVERYYVVNGSIDEIKDNFGPEQQKHLLLFRSTKHKLMYLNAEKIITAFVEQENYLPYYSDVYSEYIDLFGGEVFYLQHGVLHAHVPWKYSYDRLDIAGEVVSTDYEVENMKYNYFFPDEALIKSKMPRYDYFDIDNESKKNVILFAPSWRKYLITHKAGGGWIADEKKFAESDYFIRTQNFLNSDKLAEILEENDWTLEVKLHPIFEPYKKCFNFSSLRVKFADGRDTDEYTALITDYSSFVFDFVYLNRAIVYFMPDYKEFKAGMNDYRELDIPFEKGFGKFTENTVELCDAIEKIIKNNGEPLSPYKERNADFFFDRQKNCCDKIYEAIK